MRLLKKGIVTSRASEGSQTQPEPSPRLWCPLPPTPLPPQKPGRTIQVNRKKGSWQDNCPEVSSQAHHPRYKQNHPVTTGSLDNREGKTRAENVLPQADGIRRRGRGLDCTPCSRKTGDSHMTSSTEGDYVASAGL